MQTIRPCAGAAAHEHAGVEMGGMGCVCSRPGVQRVQHGLVLLPDCIIVQLPSGTVLVQGTWCSTGWLQ